MPCPTFGFTSEPVTKGHPDKMVAAFFAIPTSNSPDFMAQFLCPICHQNGAVRRPDFGCAICHSVSWACDPGDAESAINVFIRDANSGASAHQKDRSRSPSICST